MCVVLCNAWVCLVMWCVLAEMFSLAVVSVTAACGWALCLEAPGAQYKSIDTDLD